MTDHLVILRGGPYDGQRVYADGQQSIVFDLADDRVARYRPSRERRAYTFRGYDTIVARLPLVAPREAGDE
jgi:hypothetical protein